MDDVCSAAAAATVAMVRKRQPKDSRCVRLMPGIQLTALNQRRYGVCRSSDIRALSMTCTHPFDCPLSRHVAQHSRTTVVNWALTLTVNCHNVGTSVLMTEVRLIDNSGAESLYSRCYQMTSNIKTIIHIVTV